VYNDLSTFIDLVNLNLIDREIIGCIFYYRLFRVFVRFDVSNIIFMVYNFVIFEKASLSLMVKRMFHTQLLSDWCIWSAWNWCATTSEVEMLQMKERGWGIKVVNFILIYVFFSFYWNDTFQILYCAYNTHKYIKKMPNILRK
jgi:hypothetical protein